ncbi:MAG TPA: glycosyltransferase family 2 protein [Streptosporangiaceae bacterium]|nr:glycosyltransferase family 2 protein [Streptosporangiaceae bacterium]
MTQLPEPPAAPSPLMTGLAEPVSVIMPVRNEERYLEESVRHVLGQEYDGQMELVLAVGPSRDRTARIARDLAAADDRISVVDNPTGGRAAAVNIGLRASRHGIIVRVDGHAMLPPGYIRTAVATLAETGAVNVGGIMAAEGVTPFQQAVAWAMTSPFGVGAARFHTGGEPGPADTAYMGVFRRDAIEQAGGYNEQFQIAEDWELNHRIRQAGGLIWFQPAMRVTYRPRASVIDLGRQYFQYGRWRRVVSRQHAGTINLRYLAPPVAVVAVTAGTLAGLAGLAGIAAGAAGSWPGLLTFGLVVPACYLAGVAIVSIRSAGQLSWSAAARLPMTLTTMHMCWGSGFLTSPRSLVPDSSRHPRHAA